MGKVLCSVFCQGDQNIRRGKKPFVSEVFYAFKNESSLVAPPRKIIMSNS